MKIYQVNINETKLFNVKISWFLDYSEHIHTEGITSLHTLPSLTYYSGLGFRVL